MRQMRKALSARYKHKRKAGKSGLMFKLAFEMERLFLYNQKRKNEEMTSSKYMYLKGENNG